MTTITEVGNGVGVSVRRPDGIPKVKGEFAYSSDMWAEDMLWGATLRSPHPRARIRGIELGAALAIPGVYAVLTHEDVPGRKTYGLEHHDQPVLAFSEVRYQGEPVAIVAMACEYIVPPKFPLAPCTLLRKSRPPLTTLRPLTRLAGLPV